MRVLQENLEIRGIQMGMCIPKIILVTVEPVAEGGTGAA